MDVHLSVLWRCKRRLLSITVRRKGTVAILHWRQKEMLHLSLRSHIWYVRVVTTKTDVIDWNIETFKHFCSFSFDITAVGAFKMAKQKHYPVQNVSIVYVLPDLQQLLVVFASLIHTSYAVCTVECVPTANVEHRWTLTAIPAVTLRQNDSTLRSPAENPTHLQSIS